MEGAHTFAVYQAGNLFLTRSLTTLGHQMALMMEELNYSAFVTHQDSTQQHWK